MAVKLRKRTYPEEDFQMAPMIDMVFLLLVFFMTVSTLARAEKTAELELPTSRESEVPEDLADRGVVSVDAAGQIYAGARPVTLTQMQQSIRQTLAEDPSLKVQVRADRNTPYEKIKSVLKACAEAGAYEIIFATYQD